MLNERGNTSLQMTASQNEKYISLPPFYAIFFIFQKIMLCTILKIFLLKIAAMFSVSLEWNSQALGMVLKLVKTQLLRLDCTPCFKIHNRCITVYYTVLFFMNASSYVVIGTIWRAGPSWTGGRTRTWSKTMKYLSSIKNIIKKCWSCWFCTVIWKKNFATPGEYCWLLPHSVGFQGAPGHFGIKGVQGDRGPMVGEAIIIN